MNSTALLQLVAVSVRQQSTKRTSSGSRAIPYQASACLIYQEEVRGKYNNKLSQFQEHVYILEGIIFNNSKK